MSEENGVENLEQGVYRSLWEMLQRPLRDTVRTRSLVEL